VTSRACVDWKFTYASRILSDYLVYTRLAPTRLTPTILPPPTTLMRSLVRTPYASAGHSWQPLNTSATPSHNTSSKHHPAKPIAYKLVLMHIQVYSGSQWGILTVSQT